MIPRYNDHAANERTFLAWVRTAIAIMAFGFLIEKFDLFITLLAKQLHANADFQPSLAAEFAGLGLIFIGTATIMASLWRFLHVRRLIAEETSTEYGNTRTLLVLIGLVAMIGLLLLLYLFLQLSHL